MKEYILICPFIFLLILSFFLGRKKNYRHVRNIKKSNRVLNKINCFDFDGAKINYLRKIDPFVFEELLLSALKKKGFRILRNKRYTGDGGIDGIMWDNKNRKYLIQAKRYSSYVNRQHILEFNSLVNNSNCYSGYFIHTGKTGRNTFNNFNEGRIEIISGSKLISLLTFVERC